MANVGQPYTKGGITFQRTTEGLKRIDKPKQTISVGLTKDGPVAPTSTGRTKTRSGETITTSTFEVEGTTYQTRDGKVELLTNPGGVTYRRQPQSNVPSQTVTGSAPPSQDGASSLPVSPSALAFSRSGIGGRYDPKAIIESNNALAYGTYGSPKLPTNPVEKAIFVQQANREFANLPAGVEPDQKKLARTYQYEKELTAQQEKLTANTSAKFNEPRLFVETPAPSRAQRFGFGFGQGYRNAGETLRLPASATGFGAQVGAVTRSAQFFAGAAAPGAGSALAGSRAGVTTARFLTTAKATTGGALATNIVVGTGLAAGAGVVARKRSEFINIDSFERQALGRIDSKAAMRAGERGFLEQNQFVGSRIATSLPGAQLFIAQKPSYREGVRRELLAQGVPGYQVPIATSAVLDRSRARGSGEAVEALFISRGSEVIGRQLTTAAFPAGTTLGKRAGWEVFKKTAPRIAVAGGYEGLAMYGSQTYARGESFDPKQAAIYTGVGAGFAGTFGGAIAGFGVAKPRVGKALQGAAYVTDPFEYPGDLLATATSRSRGPVLSRVVTGVPSFTTTPIKSQAPVGIFSNTPVNILANVQTSVAVQTSTNVPTATTTKVNNVFDIAINTFSPISTPTTTPVQTPSQTPTNVQTPVNILGNVNVPVSQPNPQIPIFPFMPNIPGGGSGGAGVGKRKGTKYVDEVTASRRAFNKLLGNFQGFI